MLKKFMVLVICFTLFIVSGCTSNNETKPIDQQQAKSDSVMENFHSMLQKDSSVADVAQFISDNISLVTKENASEMVIKFEELQLKKLPQYETMFTEGDNQSKFANEYEAVMNGAVKDPGLKELVQKTNNSGYKVETAEGTFFPILNYQFYKKYSDYVTPDLKNYIEIMAVESNQVPAKDAALVISWDEVVKRALEQEKFIHTYKDSVKLNDVKQLYEKYLLFTLYGLNNTPLFSYDSNTLNPKAQEAYTKAIKNSGTSDFLKILEEYLNIISKNNNKLTDEVEKYREASVKI
ncbi:hypothetical protein [Desulfotomaculum sp. 1211_IL3151]|uniref:hypothetical protein n=1 Tax=Desulfotomaculum sp. 1211_IL3151 TaxID=3084055 RepID=UPI002FD95B73